MRAGDYPSTESQLGGGGLNSGAGDSAGAQPEFDVQGAHRHCRDHRDELAASVRCGCFHCCRVYAATEIIDWIDPAPEMAAETGRSGQTALCPYCGVDAVIGDASTYPLTPAFLESMRAHWF